MNTTEDDEPLGEAPEVPPRPLLIIRQGDALWQIRKYLEYRTGNPMARKILKIIDDLEV